MKYLHQCFLLVAAAIMAVAAVGCQKSTPVDRLLEDISKMDENSAICFSEIRSKYDVSDAKYKLTDSDRHRLIEACGQIIIDEQKKFLHELRKDSDTDSIPTKLVKAELAHYPDVLVKQVNDCHTFGEFLLVTSDLLGINTWTQADQIDFLPDSPESVVVDNYIQFYQDEAAADGPNWPLAKCHRAFHRAVIENIAISESSIRKITNEITQFELKQLNKQKAEMGDLMKFMSESEMRQCVEAQFINCKNFKDLPNLWFLL